MKDGAGINKWEPNQKPKMVFKRRKDEDGTIRSKN
jgi:hypothetical protein